MEISRRVLVLAFLAAIQVAPSAHAYLDPGSGSFIMQAIVAAFIGASLALKVFWQRVKAFFARLFSRAPATDE